MATTPAIALTWASALVAAILLAAALSMPVSADAGSWSKAASPITGREEHTATLLANGKVLIAGGTDGKGKALASAEVYDPGTNRWTATASMASARLDHTATLLPSGKVLVAGGLVGPDPFGSLTTTELYDPMTDSWSAAAPMIVSRARHTATLLPDGRVLVVGGLTLALREGGLVPSQPTDAEVYDPTTNHWAATGPMRFYRLDHTATRLADGRVLVAGGQGNATTFNSTEIFDETANRWVSAAPMAVRRSGHAATLLPDGDVLVAGGIGETANSLAISLTSAEIYDPRTNIWVSIADMARVHLEHSATLLNNRRVLVVGLSGGSRPEVYDLARNIWSAAGPSMDRYNHTATRLPNGKALIVGGYALESLDSALLYDPAGTAPAPGQPTDPRVIAAVPLTVLLIVIGIAFSIPAVRQRLPNWRPRGQPDEWIT